MWRDLIDKPDVPHTRATRAIRRRWRLAFVAVLSALLLSALVASFLVQEAFLRGQSAKPGESMPVLLLLGVIAPILLGGIVALWVLRSAARAAEGQVQEGGLALEEGQRKALEALAALSAAIEAKDPYTAGHGLRTAMSCALIGKEMGFSDAEVEAIRIAARFHDIGTIAVPDSILAKKTRLTDAEYDQVRFHALDGEQICTRMEALRDLAPAIRHHHERYDGRGYPDGLRGSTIPLYSRILAVADTWDALTSDRRYRPAVPAPVAVAELRRVSGSQLDPEVVEALLRVIERDPGMFGVPAEAVRADVDLAGWIEVRPRSCSDDVRRGPHDRVT